ncbi:sugar ABC transporter permease [Globicatella sp. HMSC072A10]|uniref:carbohydrate ABC transporter permease n=1 Tax=Globicatella sp. HMSC072A10 TaxID=1739315 RepID=UPI0008C0DE1B|nr:carbohydrate ABC transporter permease [Globicatella sp. HMSC072A10]OFK56508.1 sugar ABC transporter permease [Globicatella sp. HMSC072A10]
MKESKQYKIFKYFNNILLLLIVFLTLYPVLNIVAKSFSSEGYINSGQVGIFPKGFNLTTYKLIISDKWFWLNYKNTVVYTVVGTFISLVLTTLLAYGLSKPNLRFRGILIGIAVFTMFFGGGLVPNYVLIRELGLMNTMWAVVLPGAISIYNMLIMKSFFEGIPKELEEAASIDGLGQFRILWNIILPLSKPIIATMVLFYAVSYWNSWFSAFLYFDKKELFPVTLYLRNLIKGATGAMDAGASNADSLSQINANIKSVTMVLTILPIVTIYPFVQKYFVSGIMLGSVKQ